MLTILKSLVVDFFLKLITSWKHDRAMKEAGASEVTIGAVEKANEAKQAVDSKPKPRTIDDVLGEL